jgi:flagellar biosynthesis/type III secretory pathway protein FliH
MCEVLDRVEARGFAKGYAGEYAKGYAEGYAEEYAKGFAEGQLKDIRSLMANMGMSAAQAMDALGICPDERETFEAMLAAK